jgi:ornithine cyclodeaminase/alanine dehydrogenase
MENRLLYLSQADVESVGLTMGEIIDLLETAFEEKGAGRVEMPPKPGIHPGGGDNFIHAMPAYIPAMNSAGIKWVSGFPGNKSRGLPYISGLLILNDAATGLPLAVMDCGWITGVRTGAATAIAARYLARPESATLGILACGVQGRTNLAGLNVLFPLERVRAFDTDRATAEAFAREMSGLHAVEVVVVDTPREAVVSCDMVVTSGPILRQPHATIQPGWLDEGAFASLVDFDSYWHPDALAEAEKLCTDDMNQFLYY